VDSSTELFIDALRGIAALMVLLSHSVDLAISQVHGWEFGENPPFWRAVRATLGTGEYWVWCFFVLSGFCIHLSIARSLREGRFRFFPYALARVSRIYPLYLIGLALAIVTYELVPDLGGYDGHVPVRQFWASLMSLQILTNTFPGFAQSWSLSCEMIYYAIWPALLWVAKGSESKALKTGFFGSFVLAAGIFILWEVYHTLEGRASVDGVWTLAVLFILWLAGAGLSISWDTLSAATTLRRWHAGMGIVLAAVGLLAVMRYQQYPSWTTHVAAWTAMPGMVLIIAGARHFRLNSAPEWAQSACRWLGLFSYPCYILHDQLLLLLDHYVEPLLPAYVLTQPILRAGLYIAIIVPPLMLAGPSMERYFMSWRARWLRGWSTRFLPVKP
jgi:peptidoglycan/LPS O-acetylase OafA/YrhL